MDLRIWERIKRVLKDAGSLVIDLGSGWSNGTPTKNLYEYRLLLQFVDELDFYLAQDFLVGSFKVTYTGTVGHRKARGLKML